MTPITFTIRGVVPEGWFSEQELEDLSDEEIVEILNESGLPYDDVEWSVDRGDLT